MNIFILSIFISNNPITKLRESYGIIRYKDCINLIFKNPIHNVILLDNNYN